MPGKRCLVFIEGLPDAFSKYSNQEVRMDRLLYRRASAPPTIPSNTGNNMDTTTTKNTHATSRRPPRRVTRLSFELHPSLVLDPILLSAIGGMDDSTLPTNINYDECESSTAK